jgi:hypothetical protein
MAPGIGRQPQNPGNAASASYQPSQYRGAPQNFPANNQSFSTNGQGYPSNNINTATAPNGTRRVMTLPQLLRGNKNQATPAGYAAPQGNRYP